MSEDINTTKMRMAAQDVVLKQTEVCKARRENIEDKLTSLTDTVRINAAAIATLTSTVAVLASTVTSRDADIKATQDDVKALHKRPMWAAAIGAAVPVVLGFLLWWFSR